MSGEKRSFREVEKNRIKKFILTLDKALKVEEREKKIDNALVLIAERLSLKPEDIFICGIPGEKLRNIKRKKSFFAFTLAEHLSNTDELDRAHLYADSDDKSEKIETNAYVMYKKELCIGDPKDTGLSKYCIAPGKKIEDVILAVLEVVYDKKNGDKVT